MRRHSGLFLLMSWMVVFFSCCYVNLAVANGSALQPVDAQTQASAIAKGAKLWADNCARCHRMRNPRELTAHAWHVVVTHMRIRAGLTGQDADAILNYLDAAASK